MPEPEVALPADYERHSLRVCALQEALRDVRVGVQYLMVYGCDRTTCQKLIAHIDTALDVAKAATDPP